MFPHEAVCAHLELLRQEKNIDCHGLGIGLEILVSACPSTYGQVYPAIYESPKPASPSKFLAPELRKPGLTEVLVN
jgi:hypothetical protein